jgi:Spy/CpxP family protein refolding chaperone
MKLSRAAIALYIGLVFASGAVLGGFGHRLYTVSSVSAKTARNPEEFRKRYLAEMQKRLNLTQDQVMNLNAILDQTRSRYHEAKERMRESLREEQVAKVRAILTPDQQLEYEKVQKERAERQKQKASEK